MTIRLLLLMLSLLVAACASREPGPTLLLPAYPPEREYTDAQANEALSQIAQERARQEAGWRAELAACARRFLASDCSMQVVQERRVRRAELDRIAIDARRALRENEAIRRNQAEALRPPRLGLGRRR